MSAARLTNKKVNSLPAANFEVIDQERNKYPIPYIGNTLQNVHLHNKVCG